MTTIVSSHDVIWGSYSSHDITSLPRLTPPPCIFLPIASVPLSVLSRFARKGIKTYAYGIPTLRHIYINAPLTSVLSIGDGSFLYQENHLFAGYSMTSKKPKWLDGF